MTTPVTIELPANLSYSQKSSLAECGGRYYLERGQKVPQRPGWANVGGTAGHTTTEILDRRLYDTGEHVSDLATITDIFLDTFEEETAKTERISQFDRAEFRASGRASKEWPAKETPEWWLQKGPEMCLSWVRWRDAFPYQIATVDKVDPETGEIVPTLALEVECRPVMPDTGVEVVAFIDRVFVDESGDEPVYVILDLKFGSYTPASNAQLETYHLALLEDYGIDAAWGTYWMSRKCISTPTADLRAAPAEMTRYDYRMAHEQRMRGDFRYKPSMLCNGCSVNAYCPSFGGEYAGTIPQPWDLTGPPTLRAPRAHV